MGALPPTSPAGQRARGSRCTATGRRRTRPASARWATSGSCASVPTPTTLCATATYLYAREHARLVETYLDEGNPRDQPGNFIAWLYGREPVYAYRFDGGWYDIGDIGQLLESDNRLRARRGLRRRGSYSLE